MTAILSEETRLRDEIVEAGKSLFDRCFTFGSTGNIGARLSKRELPMTPTSASLSVHAASIDLDELGARRSINLPGVSATVGEQIEALRRAAGDQAVSLIREVPDAEVLKISSSWPKAFTAERAKGLGFTGESSMDETINIHVEDELGGSLNARPRSPLDFIGGQAMTPDRAARF
jgi:hypothetical protein